MKTTFTANFSNGRTATRTTAKDYRGAYIVTVDGGKTVIASGFAATKEAAEKVAAREVATQLRGPYGDKNGKFAERGPSFEAVGTSCLSPLAKSVGALLLA